MPSYDSVATAEGARAIVEPATSALESVDVLLNGAGILRDKTLLKRARADWQAVLDAPVTDKLSVPASGG